jgi:hypothetical protein
MPQIGHAPGESLRISGCIGHVQMIPDAGAAAFGSAVVSLTAVELWCVRIAPS